MLCSTNAIESLNARYRRAVESSWPFPYRGGCAEVSVFGDTFARPDRQGPGTMDNEVEARSERVCDHVRRSLAGIGNLLMENRRNTVKEDRPSDAGLAVLVGCTLLAAAALLGYTWWSWNSSAPRRAEDMADDYVLTHGGFRANSVVFERSRRRSHGQRNGGASGPCRWVGSNGGKGCGHQGGTASVLTVRLVLGFV